LALIDNDRIRLSAACFILRHMASTRMGNHAAERPAEFAESHRPDLGDIGYEMTQQILDAVPERRR
jgi:uncharacterized membrane protein YcjF (UPF0283 family)